MVIKKPKIIQRIKFKLAVGEAKPAPPLGPILGQNQIAPQLFISKFDEITENFTPGLELPVIITKFNDKSIIINYKMPTLYSILEEIIYPFPTSLEIEENIKKIPEKKSLKNKSITIRQLYDIIKIKKQFVLQTEKKELDEIDVKLYTKALLGTLRSMKIKIKN